MIGEMDEDRMDIRRQRMAQGAGFTCCTDVKLGRSLAICRQQLSMSALIGAGVPGGRVGRWP